MMTTNDPISTGFLPPRGQRGPLLILLAVILFHTPALAIDPPPAGGYPSNNTALGTDALLASIPPTPTTTPQSDSTRFIMTPRLARLIRL